VWLVWWAKAHRAASDARRDLRYGRGWAIGGWFVPFANLVVPKRVADDLYTAACESERPRDAGVARSGLVVGWWTAWIALGFVSLSIRGNGTTVSEALLENTVGQLHELVLIVAAALAFRFVNTVTVGFEAQTGAARERSSGGRRTAFVGGTVVLLIATLVTTRALVGFPPHHAAASSLAAGFDVPGHPFSIEVPDTWSVTARSKLDAPLVYEAGNLDDQTSVTVVEVPRVGTIDLETFESTLTEQLDVVGTVARTSVELPGGHANCFAVTANESGSHFDYRFYLFEDGQSTFLVTVTAPTETIASTAPVLDGVVSSFRMEAAGDRA
jgi:hypothetical protein